MNAYQRRKARSIAAVLLLAATQTDIPFSQLALLASRMSHREWVTVSLQAGVAVADDAAKALVVAMLGGLV